MTSTVPAPVARTADGSALQAVLLDMDGTLVDTEGFWWEIEAEIFQELGHRLEDAWRDVVVGGPMSRSAAFLIESTGAAIGLAELSVLLNERFEARIADRVPLMPGAERLLTELARHNVPTALVSASHRRVIDQVLLTLGRDRFTMTVAGDEVARTKPHPDPYLFAARSLGAHLAVRGHRGHPHRRGGRRGGRLPGRGHPLGRRDRARPGTYGRPLAGGRGSGVPALAHRPDELRVTTPPSGRARTPLHPTQADTSACTDSHRYALPRTETLRARSVPNGTPSDRALTEGSSVSGPGG